MEEKKFDLNSLIGFILIFGIMLFWFYQNQPTPEELEAQEKEKQEQVEKDNRSTPSDSDTNITTSQDFVQTNDSLRNEEERQKFGSFASPGSVSSDNAVTEIETDLFQLKFSSKGGYLSEIKLKKYVDYDSVPIYLVKDGNTKFNLTFGTTENRIINTEDIYFEPEVTQSGNNTIVSMKKKISERQYLEYRYEIQPNDYMMNMTIRSQGLNGVFDTSKDINLDWRLKGLRHDKSISYENRYTRLTYQYEDGDKIDKLAQQGEDEEVEEDVTWLSYRQHFFSSILVTDKPFRRANIATIDLVEDDEVDTTFTKEFISKIPLAYQGAELNNNFRLYFGPTDSKILKQYDEDLEESIPFGWGIFGWINKAIFIPLFAFLSGLMPYGIAIIVMTILIKLCLSFVQYKQFLSQAKMKILKPELDAIRAKHKDNKMKAQQETMALQTKAGASPLSGCLPGLMQIPVFYALFMFFPTAFDLRQKKFLWVDDLSSYDVIAELPFHIPFYGDHVSLFPILAAIAIFFYMKLTTGQQMASQPTQEGMPDMAKMMKYMIYFSPLLMLVFFNQYASGLSLYYFVSNVISIILVLIIKNFILDEDKIHAQIQENKKKPKKQNRFQRKMAEMMEEAEKQKKKQGR